MKKIILFVFILMLLSFAMWCASAWYFGSKTESYVIRFIENTKQNPDSLFDLDLIAYKRSIFNSKAKVKLNINAEHNISRLLKEKVNGFNERVITVNITHGPLLINSQGIVKANSSWVLVLDQQSSQDALALTSFEKLLNANILIDYENVLRYRLPYKTTFQGKFETELFIYGLYDLDTSRHQGIIESNELKYQDESQEIITTEVNFKYQQIDINNSEKIQFKVTGVLPNIRYGFILFPQELRLKGNYVGDFSIEKDEVNLYSQLLFDMTGENQSLYPIEKGDLRLKVSKLNLDSLRSLNAELSEVQNLQDQAQWILEEQGEFPEGQDQIWELQDREIRYFRKLPQLVNNVIFADGSKNIVNGNQKINDASIRFYLKTEYNNEDSSINGAIYPSSFESNELDVSQLSFASLIHPQAKVRLNEDWLSYLSSRFPIIKNDFTLTYKDKQLLMQ